MQFKILEPDVMELQRRTGVLYPLYSPGSETENEKFYFHQSTLIKELHKVVDNYQKDVFVIDDIKDGKCITITINTSIFDSRLIARILKFLFDNDKEYTVNVGVYDDIMDGDYLGYLCLNVRQITLESTLKSLFDKQLGNKFQEALKRGLITS